MSRDSQTLLDLARASSLIIQFAEGTDKISFMNNVEKQSAVLYQVAILGEAVKRLSKEFRASNPEIAWSSIAGMRDKLIHDYNEVDLELVWRVATENVPEFRAALEPLLPIEEE